MASKIKIAVVGGGLAGLAAAMKIAEAGHEVDLISVVPVKRSHSVCAQGGINGAVNTNYGPYEGWKDSGFGLELSRRAIYEYLHTKHIKVQI